MNDAVQAVSRTAGDRRDVVAALCDLAAHGDAADRCHCCRALGQLRDRAGVAALIRCLRDADIDVCVEAASALGRLGSAQAEAALLRALGEDPDDEVRIAAVRSLGRLGSADAVSALLAIAARPPQGMMASAADAWDPWWDMQLEAVEALGRLRAPAALSVLESILADEHMQDIEAAVLKSLALIGSAGERSLQRMLAQGNERRRRRAATALASGCSVASLKALGAALLDASAQVRSAAVEALAERRAKSYLPAIVHACEDPSPDVQAAAARACASLSCDEGATGSPAGERLTTLLAHPEGRIRALAVQCLGAVPGDPDKGRCERVLGMLADEDDHVACGACALLGRWRYRPAEPALTALLANARRAPETRSAAARALGRAAPWSEALHRALRDAALDASAPVRLGALEALRQLASGTPQPHTLPTSQGDEAHRPVDLIIALLRGSGPGHDEATPAEPRSLDADSELTRAGTNAAPRRPAGSTLAAITMDNTEIALELEAAQAEAQDGSGEWELPGASEDPTEDLSDYYRLVQRNEADAEWLFSHDALPAAQDVRRIAARILGELGDRDAFAALVDALHDPHPDLCRESAFSLARAAVRAPGRHHAARAADILIAHLSSTERDLRIAALRALGELGDARTGAAIRACLGDDSTAVRIEAVRAATRLSTRMGTDAAPRTTLADELAMLEDPEAGVRGAAAEGLVDLLHATPAPEPHAVLSIVEHICAAAFRGAGQQTRGLGRCLRAIDRALATRVLLPLIGAQPDSAHRRVVIELLANIYYSGREHPEERS